MLNKIIAESLRLSDKGFTDKQAIQTALVNVHFQEMAELGLVSLNIVPDDDFAELQNENPALYEQAKIEGLWKISGKFRTDSSHTWIEDGFSISGFVGTEWKDSLSEKEVKEHVLELLDKLLKKENEC